MSIATEKTSTNGTGAIEVHSESLAQHVPELPIERINLTVIGDHHYVSHAWSAKAREWFGQQGAKRPKKKKEQRNPQAEMESALYYIDKKKNRYGIPSIAFKKAGVAVCGRNNPADYISAKVARQAFFVLGDLVEIQSDPKVPTVREDFVKIGGSSTDLRFRPQFDNWYTTLPIKYNTAVISPEQLVHIFNLAGFGVGVGENRPEKRGNCWGTFHVASDVELEALEAK